MNGTLTVLRQEFDGEPGSFLLQLRCNLEWDWTAFNRLTGAMLTYVQANEDAQQLPRWIAEGFWYLQSFVKDWSSHESFPRTHNTEYYQAAYSRLDDLASWLFTGSSPCTDNTGRFEPL